MGSNVTRSAVKMGVVREDLSEELMTFQAEKN